jgi:DNA-nicking Smr family endonuclease
VGRDLEETRANIAVEEPLRGVLVKPKPDAHDIALFREAVRGVTPLRQAERVAAAGPRPRPRARVARAGRLPVLEELRHAPPEEPELAAADPSLFARAGVAGTTLRKLRRGQYHVQAELDLHGLTVAAATVQLREFLHASLQHNARCLRIVHGKGLRSGSRGPVLRQLVNTVLRGTAPVLAFASARPVDGGTGALYVLLDATHASSASSTTE